MSDNYHHGNLKQELIEQGLKIINEEGEDKLSFRKVAAACGVSHTAAYAHFPDKESMINSIKESAAQSFCNELFRATSDKTLKNAEERIVAMGKRYVGFFVEKPDYFRFLFGNSLVNVHFDVSKDYEEDFPAFRHLKELYLQMNKENGIIKSKQEQEAELIRIWSSVHGLASVACMDTVVYDGSWEKYAEDFIR